MGELVLTPLPPIPTAFADACQQMIRQAVQLEQDNKISFGHCFYLMSKVVTLIYNSTEHNAFCTSTQNWKNATELQFKETLLAFERASEERTIQQLPEFIKGRFRWNNQLKQSPEFVLACENMVNLVVKLKDKKQLSTEQYVDLLSKTARLVDHPEEHLVQNKH